MNERNIGKTVGKKLVLVEGSKVCGEQPLLWVYYQVYSFYLRFMKEHFTPCSKCQDELHKYLTNGEYFLSTEDMTVSFEITNVASCFYLYFMHYCKDGNVILKFIPCKECQESINEYVRNAEFIIGNKEYSTIPIEFSRTWDYNDQYPLAEVTCKYLYPSKIPVKTCEICNGMVGYEKSIEDGREFMWTLKDFPDIYLCRKCGRRQKEEFEKDQKSLRR